MNYLKLLRYEKIINKVNDECIICLNIFEDNDEVYILNCNDGHYYHKDCLDTINTKNCPLCYTIINSTEVNVLPNIIY